jgi:ribosomal protein S21
VQGINVRGWGYLDKLLKKLRKRMKIKEVLQILIEGEAFEGPSRKHYIPVATSNGRKEEMKPDYWEWGI